MNCPRCGTLNPDDGQLCQVCSWVLRGDGLSTIAENPEAKVSSLATTSKVLGILGLFTFGITFLPAFICGLIAVFKIDRSAGRLRGKGNAIFGMAAPIIFMPIIMILMAILMPALGRTRCLAQRLVCGTNLKGLGTAMMVYSNDNDGQLPVVDEWCDLLISEADVSPQMLRCTAIDEGSCGYAMNVKVVGKRLDTLPRDMVLLFETYPGWNQYGGSELVNIDNHGEEGFSVVYCDGHVEFVKTPDLEYLVWDESEAVEVENAQN